MKKAGFAAVIGKPNAGKSTLVNSLLGVKLSIVTDKPQTTRKNVLGIYSDDNNQIIFSDTPGILKPQYELHNSMMSYVEDALKDTDIILLVIDVSHYKSVEDYFNHDILNSLAKITKPKILVLNKIDLLGNVKELLPIIQQFSDTSIFQEIFPVSAHKSANVAELLKTMEKYLPESEFYYDPEMLSTQSQRFFTAEIIRENIFKLFMQEIPYSSEVNIVEFKEHSGKWYISADIIIERNSQKIIVVGKNGEQIKKLGTRSRLQIEEHLGREVYLELFVKVREKWRNKKNMLQSFGY